MADSEHLALIHAEIDGELDGRQRGELARRVLADPEAQALREDLRRLCAALDAIEAVDPPQQLRQSILNALPQSTPSRPWSWWSAPPLRYAALIAGALAAGAVVYETVEGPRPATSEVAGTMSAGAPTIVDTVRLGNGVVSGRVSLYRDRAGLGLQFELVASAPVDVLVAGDGHTLRVNGLGRDGPGGPRTAVALPGFGRGGEAVDVTFLMAGRQVGRATLRAPKDR
jgi:hypothetical protein